MKKQIGVLFSVLLYSACGSESDSNNIDTTALSIGATSNAQTTEIAAPPPVQPQEEPIIPVKVKVGEFVNSNITIDKHNNYTQTVTDKNAAYLKAHFAEIKLEDGDYIKIEDSNSEQVQHYQIENLSIDAEGGWWALTVIDNSMTISIANDDAPVSEGSFVIIDKYTQGFTEGSDAQLKANPIRSEKTCGAIDYRDAMCYEDSHPVEYARTRPTARLLLNHGRNTCTGWRVGPNDDTMMTNEHCIASQAELDAAEVWFNYQRTGCATGKSRSNMTIVKGDKLLSVDAGLDYALFTVDNPAAIQQFGYYDLDTRAPAKNERIYIPQHPNSKPKQLAIFSDRNSGGYCAVDTPLRRSVEMGYMCDTEGGSSGSAVLSAETDKVIGLHHTGGCTNNAVRIDKIWPHIADFLEPVDPTIPAKANNGDIINLAEQGFKRWSSNNADDANHQIIDDSREIKMTGNLWLRSAQLYTLSPNTIIEFTFSSNETGEIHGIGFDEDNTASKDRLFKLAGTQDWGISDFVNNNNTRYSIPVGQYYTGEMRLVLSNDNDSGAGNVSSFRNIRICESACPISEGAVTLTSNTLTRYSSSTDPAASFDINNNGDTITLDGNLWLRTDQEFDISSNTILSFDFKSDGTGEIQGIGFDEDGKASSNRIFALSGTQDWGISNYTNDGQTRRYEIPVGNYYTGRMHLILVNDNDAGSGNITTLSNIRLCHGSCVPDNQAPSPTSPPPVEPTPNSVEGITVTGTDSVEFNITADMWADVHFKVNAGEQQNFRMRRSDSTHTHILNGLRSGDRIEFKFTSWDSTCSCAKNSNWQEFTF